MLFDHRFDYTFGFRVETALLDPPTERHIKPEDKAGPVLIIVS